MNVDCSFRDDVNFLDELVLPPHISSHYKLTLFSPSDDI